jgi:hypothetical protein
MHLWMKDVVFFHRISLDRCMKTGKMRYLVNKRRTSKLAIETADLRFRCDEMRLKQEAMSVMFLRRPAQVTVGLGGAASKTELSKWRRQWRSNS